MPRRRSDVARAHQAEYDHRIQQLQVLTSSTERKYSDSTAPTRAYTCVSHTISRSKDVLLRDGEIAENKDDGGLKTSPVRITETWRVRDRHQASANRSHGRPRTCRRTLHSTSTTTSHNSANVTELLQGTAMNLSLLPRHLASAFAEAFQEDRTPEF